MSDVFASSRRKIARAQKHLEELKLKVAAVFGPNLYEEFTEPHPDMPEWTVHKVRLTRQVPDDFSEIAGDVVDNLRSALDHAVYGVAVASGHSSPKNAYFPFSISKARFETNLKGRCADVPQEIWPIFRACKPYKGGNPAFWALNLVCGTNKHAILVPAVAAVIVGGMDVHWTGGVIMPTRPMWDSTKQEMEMFSTAPGAEFHGKFQIGFSVAFGKIETLEGKNAIPILDKFVELVELVVGRIEAESKRLGIVK
jgi:hypothetical protein